MNQLIHLMYLESLKTNLRSPSWDLHWHDFRSPTGASVQLRHKLCRDILQQAEVCFFACYWFWAMERPACGTSRECWCQTLAFARSFMKFSKSCLKTVHGWSHTWVFRGFGDSWFLLYLWGKSIVADELWLQLCSSLKTRSSYPEWCLRMRNLIDVLCWWKEPRDGSDGSAKQ